MPVEGFFYPAGDNINLAAASMAQYPEFLIPFAAAGISAYSGSTSANGASTHSTMSYYVAPLLIPSPLVFTRMGIVDLINTSAAGTGSATYRQYVGLYSQTSDSISLMSSWMGGVNLSQNSATALTLSAITGSGSGSVGSYAGNSTAAMTGTKIQPIAQGASSVIYPAQYYLVVGNHAISGGIQPLSVSIAVPNQTYVEVGQNTSATAMYQALNGAFSSTSMTNVANSNQWLMPPSVATAAITATRSNEQIRPTVIFRGI